MASACFVTPASISLSSTKTLSSSKSVVRPQTTMSLRLPGCSNGPFGNNPFGGNSGRFFNFGSGFGSGNIGGNWGNGRRDGGGRSAGGGSGASSGDESSGNIFTSIWNAYNARLDQNPITTKAMTSLIGFFLGDVIAQKFLGEKGAPIDWSRVARMASFGFLIHGPTGHYFYSALDRMIVGTSPVKVASKVIIDQVCWAPIFTALFFSYLGFAEGKSVDDVISKIKNDTWTGVTTSWKFWPLAHCINFAFIPTSQRLLYVNTLQVGYNVILSLLGNK